MQRIKSNEISLLSYYEKLKNIFSEILMLNAYQIINNSDKRITLTENEKVVADETELVKILMNTFQILYQT